MDDADLLVDVVRTTIGNAAGNELHALLVAARAAANSADWQSRTAAFRASYRAWVKSQLQNFIPPPVFALPGVPALVDTVLDRALDEGAAALADAAKEISLGPISASLGLPAVMLTPPALNPALPPALIGFRPPTGLALSFGSGPASGGGALDYQRVPNPRLSGGFGLKLGVAQVGALAILEEVDGGASLLTLLSARFAPGIQLGFGFAISGVGGLIGVNRAADVAALEAQFRGGALVNALFGDNPIGNAVNTLNTLGAVFRARQGAHVFGPTLQISWLKVAAFTLFNADLGVFMALPGPSRVDVIGSARAAIPLVFQLRLDVRGEIDVGRRIIGLHAVIVDSHVMGVFRMQGEALFRLRYGDDPYAVLTIGGFFPGFNPAPAEVPGHLPRVGMALELPVSLPIYLRAEGYLAVTSNTLQFGGLLEAGFDGGFFSADGHLALDAIFQFDPFEFDVRFSAGFHVNVLGKEFYGVECSGRITGPNPVVIRARISYKTPFFLPDINWSDTFTIGSGAPRLASTADLFVAMKAELRAPGNLRAEGGEDPHVTVTVRGQSIGDQALLSPLGQLIWVQRLAPLNLELQRLQNVPLESPNGVTVTAALGQLPDGPRERFNLGMYRNLSDAERLNLNVRVVDHLAGVRLGFPLQRGASVNCEIKFAEYHRPLRPGAVSSLRLFTFGRALLDKVSARSAPAHVANLEPTVTTPRESWRAAGQTFDTEAAAHVTARATGAVAHLAMDVVDVGGI